LGWAIAIDNRTWRFAFLCKKHRKEGFLITSSFLDTSFSFLCFEPLLALTDDVVEGLGIC